MGNSVAGIFFAIAILVSLIWCGLHPPPRSTEWVGQSSSVSVPEEVTAWISRHAREIEWTEPLSVDVDMGFLPGLIGDASIVMLGEATHGTRECRTANARITRYMAEEMGLSCLALEESPERVRELNRYIEGRGSTAEDAVRSLGSWVWKTEGMADFAKWLREHNETASDPIRLVGIDMGDPWASIEAVSSYFEEHAPLDEGIAKAAFESFLTHQGTFVDYADLDEAEQSVCRSGLQRVFDWLVEHRGILTERSSEAEYLAALFSARSILYSEEAARSGAFPRLRERCMAENVLCLAEHFGRTAVWAHNLHVSTLSIGEWRSMGSNLKEMSEEPLITLGFSLFGGEFTSLVLDEMGTPSSLRAVPLPPPGTHSIEDAFHGTGLASFVLDLRCLESGSFVADWFCIERSFRTIGATYSPSFSDDVSITVPLPNLFDMVIHLQTSRPTTLLRPPASEDSANLGAGAINTGFEDGLRGWQLSGTDPGSYQLEVVSRDDNLGACAELSSSSAMPDVSGNVKQTSAAGPFRGAQLRMTAQIRVADIEGWAGMWLVVLTPDGVAAMDTMSDRPIRGDMGWHDVEILVDVPEDAETLFYGVSLYGRGTVWVDAVQLTRIE